MRKKVGGIKMTNIPPVGDFSIDELQMNRRLADTEYGARITATDCIKDLQSQRGSVYGKFEAQAKCVGAIIQALINCCKENDKEPTEQQIGAFAYQAIKQARYAVSPSHADTLIDLESYCNLIKKMEIGDVEEHT